MGCSGRVRRGRWLAEGRERGGVGCSGEGKVVCQDGVQQEGQEREGCGMVWWWCA